jgi:uncharacterized protein (DUF362 family)
MKRREFLQKIGQLFLLSSILSLEGCTRLFQDTSREKAVQKSIKVTERKPLEKKEAPEETKSYPELAVVKGGNPSQNLKKALEKIGGIERFVKRGAKVVIKPNILTARRPEFAVTTNPILIGGLVKMCYEAGASEVTVLDRPTTSPRIAYEVSGIAQATRRAGGKIKILTERNFENTLIPEGEILKKWPLVKDIFEADVFINVPIAKTHSLATLTMAMKNLMGIMGGSRSQMHIDFDQKIVDLNTLVKPHLVILDAHRILIRNGPTGGSLSDVREIKTLIAGTNQVTVDAYGATLFDLKPADLPYLVKAKERGLGEIDLQKIKIAEEILS